jgi:hypothetical protein
LSVRYPTPDPKNCRMELAGEHRPGHRKAWPKSDQAPVPSLCQSADRRRPGPPLRLEFSRASVARPILLSNLRNHFLSQLPDSDRELLLPHLRTVELEHAKVLHRAGDVIERSYFPTDGVVSFVVGMSDGRFVEAGMFGRNSLVSQGRPLMGKGRSSRLSFRPEGPRRSLTHRL